LKETKTKKRIVVAMSGGVDSSVTAALLKEQGNEIIGVTMRVCTSPENTSAVDGEGKKPAVHDNVLDARDVAKQLDIPFHVINLEEEFQRLVIDYFVEEYFSGRTPNPCVRCNRLIKFDLLLEKARQLGGDFLATGHYSRLIREGDGRVRMMKGVDAGKDQSYFLFTLTQEQLASTLFPLGGMTKREVRAVALRYGLKVAEKGESQEICFVPDDNYVRLLEAARGEGTLSGNIVDRRGNILGRHEGTYRYTIGQRKGLGIAHPHPLYVLGVDVEGKEVIVGAKDELITHGLIASKVNWISARPDGPIDATCKIRYRQKQVKCTIIPQADDSVEVRFETGEKGVTPGQAVVFYDGDEVLGGGIIETGNGPFPQSRR
jgi:tRNA-specific 2-thiouridylase